MAASQQDDPGKRDLSSRLVGGIKSAMGEEMAPASPALRAIFAAVAVASLALWFASLIPPYESWGDPREDGFSFVPAFYATITMLPVGIYLLIGAIIGHGKSIPRARKALIIGIALLFLVVALWILQFIANTPDS